MNYGLVILTYINASLDCFQVTLEVESIITCCFIVSAYFVHWLDYRDDAIFVCIAYVHYAQLYMCKLFTIALYGIKTSHRPFK